MHPETLRNVGRAPVWRRRVRSSQRSDFPPPRQVRAYGADDDRPHSRAHNAEDDQRCRSRAARLLARPAASISRIQLFVRRRILPILPKMFEFVTVTARNGHVARS